MASAIDAQDQGGVVAFGLFVCAWAWQSVFVGIVGCGGSRWRGGRGAFDEVWRRPEDVDGGEVIESDCLAGGDTADFDVIFLEDFEEAAWFAIGLALELPQVRVGVDSFEEPVRASATMAL